MSFVNGKYLAYCYIFILFLSYINGQNKGFILNIFALFLIKSYAS